MDYRDFITSALEEASQIANDNFGKVSGTTKGEDNNQVLTITDKEIGQLLIQRVQEYFPIHNIIDEEAGVIDKNSEFTWVIDPIDGTSNFASGIPTYGIYLGLLQNNIPIAGGAALPAFGKIYTAEKGMGTFCNKQKVQVIDQGNLLSTLVAYQIDGYQEDPQITYDESKILSEIILHCRNLRTSNCAFDAAMVIEGKYGGVLNKTSKIWDNVAPQILIEEAGGIYTDFYGNPMDYSNPLTKAKDNFTYCAASPLLHQQLQGIIHKN